MPNVEIISGSSYPKKLNDNIKDILSINTINVK